ncbi:hypothetical protein RE9414_28870 [Prescottella equi]|nr:hypothetical protein RE9414_28870 [Prescottella equi]
MVASYVDERYAPVRAEVTEFDLPVRGTIPEWLDGRYLRNGPNPIAQVRPDEYNWFTGDGMVHGIRISGGRALWYRNRWVDSEVTSRALHRSAPPEHGRSPLHGPSANTNVIGFAGRTLALVEAGVACAELSYDLDTVDVCDFDGTVRGGYTAHSIEDRVPVSCTPSPTTSVGATPSSTPSSDRTAVSAASSRSGSGAAR